MKNGNGSTTGSGTLDVAGRASARAGVAGVRVLDITSFYSPESGGVKTYLNAKMRDFAERRLDHSLVVPHRSDEVDAYAGSRVYRVRCPTIPFSPDYRLLVPRRRLRRILEEEQPQVVEVGSPFVAPHLVRWASNGRRPKTVGFYHTDLLRDYVDAYLGKVGESPRKLGRAAARRFVRSVYGSFDATVAASRTVAEELREMGVRNVRWVPLGVDLGLFRPGRDSASLRSRLGIAEEIPIGLYAGRFYHEKRIDVLLEAHHRLPEPDRPHLVFVGDGPQRDDLVRLANDRGRISVLSYMTDREALADLYGQADFYTACGPGETFGLAIVEALASGLPVVAVDSGAAPERVEGSGCGFLYENDDPESCARALRAIVRECGPELRGRARDYAERELGWSRTFDALHSLYGELASEP